MTPRDELAVRRRRQNPDIDAEIKAKKAIAWTEAFLAIAHDPVENPYAKRKQITLPPSVRELDIADMRRILGWAPKTKDGYLVGRILVVPIFVNEHISTCELIDEEGRKYSLPGGRKAGGYLATVDHLPDNDWLGDLVFVVGEGLATTISATTPSGHIGIVVFSCTNLLAIGRMLRERYPEARIIFVADLGIGVEKSIEAARVVAGLVAIPDFGEDRPEGAKDVNDLFCLRGVEAVKTCIANASPPPAAENTDEEDDKDLTQSQALMRIARDNCELYHCEGEAFATTCDGSTHAVRSKGFRMFLSQRFVGASAKAPSSQAMHEAIDTIEAVVVGGKATRVVALRVGETAGKLYIDLGTNDYQLAEVDSHRWRIVASTVPALRFRRSPSTRSLPLPTLGGALDDLRPFINVDDDGWRLALPWLVYSLQPKGPFPILVFGGEQGTAKSTASKILRALSDPSQAAVRSQPKDDDQLFVGVRGSWVLVFDNMSGMPAWLSDCLCGLATGTAQSKRTLYSDAEEHIIEATRPIIINGIDDLTARPDFASRALSITLAPIPDDKRKEESILWAEFDAARAGIFGALLTTLSKVLASRDEIHLTRSPRMADFARFGIAVERVLGWPDGSFLDAYESSQRASATTTMESNLVALAVQQFMSGATTDIRLTASDLLPRLADLMTSDQIHSRHWPLNAAQLGNQLRRVTPALRQFGISIAQTKVHGDRIWRLTRGGVTAGDGRVTAPLFANLRREGDSGAAGDGGLPLMSEEKRSMRKGDDEGRGDRTDTK
ncbi:MAG: hypothetical protein WCG85_11100, partial [Polyangia bacterium]